MTPAADHQTVIMTFFGASLALGSVLELLLRSTTELVIASCHIKSTFCRTSHSDGETAGCCYIQLEKTTHQNDDFFFFSLLRRHSFIELFQMPSDCKMVGI